MTLSLRLTTFVLAIVALLAPVSMAQAKATPEQLLQRTLNSITLASETAQRQMNNASTATVNAVNRLDAAGKSNEAIVAAGNRGTVRVNTLLTTNTNQINRRRDAGIRALTRIGATEAQIQQVTDAAATAVVNITNSSNTAKSTIQAAVTAATAS